MVLHLWALRVFLMTVVLVGIYSPALAATRVGSGGDFATLFEAYAAAANEETLQVRDGDYHEEFVAGRNVALRLQGGYDPGFASASGWTVIDGALTLRAGRLTVARVHVRPRTRLLPPTLSPPGGNFDKNQTVVVNAVPATATIAYTTDGTVPSPAHGTKVKSGTIITVDTNTAIKAIAFDSGWDPSPIVSADYIIAFQPSAEYSRLMAEYAKAQAGEPADLDGDGYADLIKESNPDGSKNVTVYDANGNPVFTRTIAADGSWLQQSDGDADGNPEATVTYQPGPPAVLTRTWDSNLDGILDTRTTRSYNSSTQQVHIVDELDEAQDGNWVTTMVRDVPSSIPAVGQDDAPRTTGKTSLLGSFWSTGNPNVNIDSSCGSRIPDIQRAFSCAVRRNKDCLQYVNSEQSGSLSDALSGGHTPLNITCSPQPGGACANTDFWKFDLGDPANMKIDPSCWDAGKDPDGRCDLVLHEMLHWAGDGGVSTHNTGTQDHIYGCAHYCANCTKSNMVLGAGNSNADCARCADTKSRKEACGIKQTLDNGQCKWSDGWGLCHAGLSCILGRCESCQYINTRTCDGEILFPTFQCCAGCSVSCDRSNDIPCSGTPPLTDTCSKKPPMCP